MVDVQDNKRLKTNPGEKMGKAPAFKTEFPRKLVYKLPKRGQEGLSKIETRLEPTGNRTYTQAMNSAGGEKFQFQFPNTKNRYVDFSNLRLHFSVNGIGRHVVDPVVGAHGMIQQCVFSTGSGEIIENYRDYHLRVAKKTKWMNDGKKVTKSMTDAEGIAVGVGFPNVAPLHPGKALDASLNQYYGHLIQNNERIAESQGKTNKGAAYKHDYSIPFRGSDFCSQVDTLIPLTVFDGLQLELTLNPPPTWISEARVMTAAAGGDNTFLAIAGAAAMVISNVYLEVVYWKVPAEDDARLQETLKSGRVIPINYLSTRILRGTEVLQDQLPNEQTITLNETLSSVRSIHVAFRDTRVLATYNRSRYYFVEPGTIPNRLERTNNNHVRTFASFQVEVNGEVQPEYPITDVVTLLRKVDEVARQDGKCVVLDQAPRDGNYTSVWSAAGEFTGGLNIDNALEAIEDGTHDFEWEDYYQKGGGFVLAVPLRNYDASSSVMNGVRMKNNACIRYTFNHSANARTVLERLIFINHDTVLEVGLNRKTMVKT